MSKPFRILFVSRLAVRKGVEVIVELSHRLSDLGDRVELLVVGDRSVWSDYRPLLADLHSGIARYIGPLSPPGLPALYRSADLLVQPSHYEPFALTVGEALASGVPVLASSAVGAAEQVDRDCCAVVPDGDIHAFEQGIRRFVDHKASGDYRPLRTLARSEAERLFDPDIVGARVASYLARISVGSTNRVA